MSVKVHSPDVPEHPALKAWRVLRSDSTLPSDIQTLKETRKGAVYRLGGVGPEGSAVIAKRCLQATARVERILYEEVFPLPQVSGLDFHGSLDDSDGYCWLFLQEAVGEPYSPVKEEHRLLAARWLATMHAAASQYALAGRLPDREAAHYRTELTAACSRILDNVHNPALDETQRQTLRKLVSDCTALVKNWSSVEKRCQSMPRTLVHGDLVEKNVRVREGADGPALAVFDWEVAGWGVPAADVAQCPDLAVYASCVQQSWPHLSARDIYGMAEVGKLFRLASAISWASWRPAYAWPERSMRRLNCYAAELADVSGDRSCP